MHTFGGSAKWCFIKAQGQDRGQKELMLMYPFFFLIKYIIYTIWAMADLKHY